MAIYDFWSGYRIIRLWLNFNVRFSLFFKIIRYKKQKIYLPFWYGLQKNFLFHVSNFSSYHDFPFPLSFLTSSTVFFINYVGRLKGWVELINLHPLFPDYSFNSFLASRKHGRYSSGKNLSLLWMLSSELYLQYICIIYIIYIHIRLYRYNSFY